MRYPRALLAVVLTGAIGAGLLPASTSLAADETSVAREHAQKGKAFMDLGKYSEAAAEYEAAYADKQDPTLLLNLAQAYRMAGNGNKAMFFYRKYLQHAPKSPYRADIEDKIGDVGKGRGNRLRRAASGGRKHDHAAPTPDGPARAPRTSAETDDVHAGSEPAGPAARCAAGQPERLDVPSSTCADAEPAARAGAE